jgi:ABC-type protease/lipase transport system fused ATPase/permease subunit
MPVDYDFGSRQFDDAVRAATRKAFDETLAAGLPVFYIDSDGLNVMEHPDGRRFEIRWLPGAPSGENYEIIRELTARAAYGSVATLTVIAGPNGSGKSTVTRVVHFRGP